MRSDLLHAVLSDDVNQTRLARTIRILSAGEKGVIQQTSQKAAQSHP